MVEAVGNEVAMAFELEARLGRHLTESRLELGDDAALGVGVEVVEEVPFQVFSYNFV